MPGIYISRVGDGPLWALKASYFSKALLSHAHAVPGMHFDRPSLSWQGHVDAVAAVAARLRHEGVGVEGETPPPDAWQTARTPFLFSTKDLRPYQVEGVRFLIMRSREGALLADAMRLGKSLEAIVAARAFKQKTLVICPSHLVGVWGRDKHAPEGPGEIAKWWPDAKVHVLETVKPAKASVLCKKLATKKRTHDEERAFQAALKEIDSHTDALKDALVVVCHYDILYAWADVLRAWGLATLIVDECHVLAGYQSRRSDAVKDLARASLRRIGLSVGPETSVLVRHGRHIQRRQIEELYTLWQQGHRGLEVRSFDGHAFVWAPLIRVIAHPPKDKFIYKVRTHYGRELTLTADHSVYTVVRGEYTPACKRGGRHSYVPILQCTRGDELHADDFMLLDTRADCTTTRKVTIDLASLVKAQRPYLIQNDRIAVPAVLGRKPFALSPAQVKQAAAMRKSGIRLRDVAGHFDVSPNTIWLALRGPRGTPPAGARIARPAWRSQWAQRHLSLVELAFLVGFFVGDGWLDQNRVNFAVAKPDLNAWMKRTKSIFRALGARPSIRQMPRGSVEVRVSSIVLADTLKSLGCVAPAEHKRLPSVLAWQGSREVLQSLVQGLEESDGHRSHSKRGGERIYYVTVSKELALDIVECLRRLGITASLSSRPPRLGGIIDGKQVIGRRTSYVVHWSPLARDGKKGGGHYPVDFTAGVIEGLPVRIHGVERIKAPKLVYDLQVKDTCNFVAGGLLAHNSGTPVTNKVRNFYNVLEVLCPDRFGYFFSPKSPERGSFARLYCAPEEKSFGHGESQKTVWDFGGKSNIDAPDGKIALTQEETLAARLKHFMLRRLKKDVDPQLPIKTRQIIDVVIPSRKVIAVHEDMLSKEGKELRRVLDLAADGKLNSVIAILKDHVAEGEKVICFCYRRLFAERVADEVSALKEGHVVFSHGGLTQKERDRRIHTLRTHDGPGVLACTIDTASTGIDLSFSSVGVVAELTWNAEDFDQLEERLYKYGGGQDNKALIQYVIARGTGDELILRGIIQKLDLSERAGIQGSGLKEDLSKKRGDGLARLYQTLIEMQKEQKGKSVKRAGSKQADG